jgi:uncharacterized membrane protein
LTGLFWQKGTGRRKLAGVTIIGSTVTLGLMLLLGIGALINFDTLFYDFHLIAFTNQFWSAEGNMLLLFPDGFWYDAAIYCILTIAALAIILGGVSWTYLHYPRKKV